MGRDRGSVCLSIPGEEGWGEIRGLSVSCIPAARGRNREDGSAMVGVLVRPCCDGEPQQDSWAGQQASL